MRFLLTKTAFHFEWHFVVKGHAHSLSEATTVSFAKNCDGRLSNSNGDLFPFPFQEGICSCAFYLVLLRALHEFIPKVAGKVYVMRQLCLIFCLICYSSLRLYCQAKIFH